MLSGCLNTCMDRNECTLWGNAAHHQVPQLENNCLPHLNNVNVHACVLYVKNLFSGWWMTMLYSVACVSFRRASYQWCLMLKYTLNISFILWFCLSFFHLCTQLFTCCVCLLDGPNNFNKSFHILFTAILCSGWRDLYGITNQYYTLLFLKPQGCQ